MRGGHIIVCAIASFGNGREDKTRGSLLGTEEAAGLNVCIQRHSVIRCVGYAIDGGVEIGEAAGVLDVLRVVGERRVRGAKGIALGQGYVTFSPLSAAADVCAIDHLCWTPIIPGPSGIGTGSVQLWDGVMAVVPWKYTWFVGFVSCVSDTFACK